MFWSSFDYTNGNAYEDIFQLCRANVVVGLLAVIIRTAYERRQHHEKATEPWIHLMITFSATTNTPRSFDLIRERARRDEEIPRGCAVQTNTNIPGKSS